MLKRWCLWLPTVYVLLALFGLFDEYFSSLVFHFG
ncbi:MAG: hypothetical protein K0Q73_4441 [Paenibacillus sp.]|nr:hypothetical protein [Paenibacillus sp.]